MSETDRQQVRRLMLEDLQDLKFEIIKEIRLTKTEIEAVVEDMLPEKHDEEHDEIRKFLDHSPDYKTHGAHHDFTESVRARLEHMIVAMFKALGGILLGALMIGLYAWVKTQGA